LLLVISGDLDVNAQTGLAAQDGGGSWGRVIASTPSAANHAKNAQRELR